MGSVGGFKKRKRAEKKAERYAAGEEPMDSGQEPADWWDGFSRRIPAGPLSLSKELNKFESIFKISRKTFNYICLLVREDLLVRTIVFASTDGKVLSVEDQIAVALRRLCSGESLSFGGLLYGSNQSTAPAAPRPRPAPTTSPPPSSAQVTWRFVEAMEERGAITSSGDNKIQI